MPKVVCRPVIATHCSRKNHFLKLTSDGTSVCVQCQNCTEGYREERPCSARKDRTCVPCENGYFSPGGATRCRKCRTECPYGNGLIKQCTKSEDIQCQLCAANSFASNTGRCERCSVCSPGRFVMGVCNSRRDTVCKACPEGSFANGFGRRKHCKTCRECEPGVQVVRNCSVTQDTLCGSCKPGYFWQTSTLECVKCAECKPGYAIEVKECKDYSANGGNICGTMSLNPAFYLKMSDMQRNDAMVEVSSKQTPTRKPMDVVIDSYTSKQDHMYVILFTGIICSTVVISGALYILRLRRKFNILHKYNIRASNYNRTTEYLQDCVEYNLDRPGRSRSQSTPLLPPIEYKESPQSRSCIEDSSTKNYEFDLLLQTRHNDDSASTLHMESVSYVSCGYTSTFSNKKRSSDAYIQMKKTYDTQSKAPAKFQSLMLRNGSPSAPSGHKQASVMSDENEEEDDDDDDAGYIKTTAQISSLHPETNISEDDIKYVESPDNTQNELQPRDAISDNSKYQKCNPVLFLMQNVLHLFSRSFLIIVKIKEGSLEISQYLKLKHGNTSVMFLIVCERISIIRKFILAAFYNGIPSSNMMIEDHSLDCVLYEPVDMFTRKQLKFVLKSFKTNSFKTEYKRRKGTFKTFTCTYKQD